MEGEGFRDLKPEFDAKDAVLLGASFDSVEQNRAFRAKFGFPFPLLCDTERALGLAYAAAHDAKARNAARITVVVGPDGKVARVYPKVDPKSHPQQVLADLG